MLSQGFLSIRRQARFWPSASGTTAPGPQNFGAPSIVPLRGFRPNNWSPSAITALQPAWLPSIPSVISYRLSRVRDSASAIACRPSPQLPRPRVRDREKPRSHTAETMRPRDAWFPIANRDLPILYLRFSSLSWQCSPFSLALIIILRANMQNKYNYIMNTNAFWLFSFC